MYPACVSCDYPDVACEVLSCVEMEGNMHVQYHASRLNDDPGRSILCCMYSVCRV